MSANNSHGSPIAPADVIDDQYQEHKIERIEEHATGYTLRLDDGWCIGLAKDADAKPAVGQTARLYGEGIGSPVRGIALDGRIAFYRTQLEQEKKQRADVEAGRATRRAKFEADRADHDARIAALPESFRARLDKLISSGPDWRWEFEDYELFCCEKAVRLAAHAREAVGTASPLEWLRAFVAASTDVQKKLAPTMKLDEHSGNTFGCTVTLARAYLEDEKLVPQMHGALATLVGCHEYGCHRNQPPAVPTESLPAGERRVNDEADAAFRMALRDFEQTPWPRPEDEPLRVGAEPRPIGMSWYPPTCNEPSRNGAACGVSAKKSSAGYRCWLHWPDKAKESR